MVTAYSLALLLSVAGAPVAVGATRLEVSLPTAFVTSPRLPSCGRRRSGAFVVSSLSARSIQSSHVVLHVGGFGGADEGGGAGGFEWENPMGEDSGVENPFKNPELLDGDGSTLKIDAARLLGPRLNGCNLYLIGMMGSGKTTVGDLIAKRMGTYKFLDTDDILEKSVNRTIADIFATEGEAEFRRVEALILDSVHAFVRCVISTGGGIVCRRENWSKLQTGIVVWLNVAPEILISRMKGKETANRPLLSEEEDVATKIRRLLDERQAQYRQADVHINIDDENMHSHDVANMVVKELHEFIDNNPPAWKQAKAKAQAEGLDWVK